jgi:hypothetical protein
MPSTLTSPGAETHALIGDLARSVRNVIGRSFFILIVVLIAETGYLLGSGRRGAVGFALISAGCCLILGVWRKRGIGLPVIPALAVQHLVAYGLPIVTANETIAEFRTEYLETAGWEVFWFCVSLTAAWQVGLQVFRPSRPISYALLDFRGQGGGKLTRLGFVLTGVATGYLVLNSAGGLDFLYNLLPSGSFSLMNMLVSAASTSGFFLLAMSAGSRALNRAGRLALWLLLAANCGIEASSLLISSAAVLLAAVMLGLFWTSGRMPWRYTLIVSLLLGFFSVGKYTMRERYWHVERDGDISETTFTLVQMPGVYLEWMDASVAELDGQARHQSRLGVPDEGERQGILSRINNLQNLLFVIRAVDSQRIEPLYGETYSLVPQELIPRVLWPGKPGSHIGQQILNVHFRRQDLISTYSTSIAWGLLPEAYGNFGPIAGALFLGIVLGASFAWVENFTAPKLIISLEGFLGFALMLAMVNSFEMVSTVLVPSIEESLIPIGLATLPFVRRTRTRVESRPPR